MSTRATRHPEFGTGEAASVHPEVLRWYRARGWEPFEFQRRAWGAYREGRDVLIHAPTGMGKTLAAWMGAVNEAIGEMDGARVVEVNATPQSGGALGRGDRASAASRKVRRGSAEALRVLWITPMRALATDTVNALVEPVRDLGLRWTIEKRTGDTTTSLRARQKEKLPTALVTTPESLSVLLSHPGGGERFGSLRCVVVDEWHELLSTKRGVQTELCLARLRRLAPGVRVIGVSATLGNLEQAMEVLSPRHGVGSNNTGCKSTGAELVHAGLPKALDVQTIMPSDVERFPWAGHLGLRIAEQVAAAVEAAGSTLLFTNTRSQAELWFRELLWLKPEWLGQLAIHHGSLDRNLRSKVEEALKSGGVKCVVCTSSLDLGVDFSPVEQVIQIGSPKGVARLMQRAGRSGHQPGATSRVLCVPTHAFELVEFAAARGALEDRDIEPREPLTLALDVLAQHVVTSACAGAFVERELLEEVRSTHAYRHLNDTDWGYVMDFVVRGGAALRAYPKFSRVARDDTGVCVIASDRTAREHRLNIGTITGDHNLIVKVIGGAVLGTIEESYIARLAPGDSFLLAGHAVELVRVREMTVEVRRRKSLSGRAPKWAGGQMSLSSRLAARVRGLVAAAARGGEAGTALHAPEMVAARPLLDLQARWSALPGEGELLIERIATRDGFHVFLFPFEGRSVHEGLGAILARRLARMSPRSITVAMNDYGLELLSPTAFDLSEQEWREALRPDDLLPDLAASVNTSEMTRRRFRDVARVAGLISQGFPTRPSAASRGGRRGSSGGKSQRHIQASADLFFDVFAEFDPANFLLEQAKREVIDDQLQLGRIHTALTRIARSRLVMVDPPQLTPMAFPIWAESLRTQQVSSERWGDRVRRMAVMLEEEASKGPRRREKAGIVRTASTRDRGSAEATLRVVG
ncbi:MAG: ligase-associated DNA damage response DEXH box helicase [Phycisphaerales bacterium]